MKDLIINNEITDYQINEHGEIYSKKTNKLLVGTIYNISNMINDYPLGS